MADRNRRNGPALAPPVGAICTMLRYAADGLSVLNQRFLPSGRPWTPDPADWAGWFRTLVETDKGVRTLRNLAWIGMCGWGCPPVYFECLDAAVRHGGFRAGVIAVLRELADTARKPFALPDPPLSPSAGERPVPGTTPPESDPRPPTPPKSSRRRRPRFDPK
jgi:hypothetical protein